MNKKRKHSKFILLSFILIRFVNFTSVPNLLLHINYHTGIFFVLAFLVGPGLALNFLRLCCFAYIGKSYMPKDRFEASELFAASLFLSVR